MVGLFFSRTLPRRLATRGGEVIFEKIPALRHALKTEAENLRRAWRRSPFIANDTHWLAPFLAAQNFWLHIYESRRRPLNALLAELDDLRRFAKDAEIAKIDKSEYFVRQKDGLIITARFQLALKLWLFLHLPPSFALMIFTLLHIVLVFAGEARSDERAITCPCRLRRAGVRAAEPELGFAATLCEDKACRQARMPGAAARPPPSANRCW